MTAFTITRRFWSSLPAITVELGAEFDSSSHSIKLGAAVKIFVNAERAAGRAADLGAADLRGADLRGANLRGAYLSGADLKDCKLPAL